MKFVSDKVNQYWNQAKDFCVYRVLHADDPPHRLALGVAIGMFVTFMPLIGFQMALSVFLAWLLRANKLVGIPLVWISNPVTIVPIYYPCYWIGCKILSTPVVTDEWSNLKVNWQTLQADPSAQWGSKVRFWWDSFFDFAGPLGLGCLVVGTTVGVIAYYGSLFAIRYYRIRRWGQLMPPGLTPEENAFGEQVDENSNPTAKNSSSGGNAA